MISWITDFLKRRRKTTREILNRYWVLAYGIGHALVYNDGKEGVNGLDVNDPELYHLLDELEILYSELGYRIVPLQDWIDHAGWGVPIAGLWLVKREKEERPVYTKFTDVPEIPKRNLLGGD